LSVFCDEHEVEKLWKEVTLLCCLNNGLQRLETINKLN
jgi:hypothetical protein